MFSKSCFFLAALFILSPSMSIAKNYGCGQVRHLYDRSLGKDSHKGAMSCIHNKDDQKILKNMYQLIQADKKLKYLRNQRNALLQTTQLLNLTNKWPGVKCADGPKGLRCKYKNHRGENVDRDFSSLSANFANVYMDKIVTTALEKKTGYNVHKNQAEQIADLKKELAKVRKERNMCGCSGGQKTAIKRPSVSGTFKNPTEKSPKRSISSNNSTTAKSVNPSSTPSENPNKTAFASYINRSTKANKGKSNASYYKYKDVEATQ